MCRVETESVELKFLNPVTPVRDEEFPDWSRVRSIKIDRIPPFVSLFANQIIIRKNTEIISVGSEVVVNDIKNYGEP